MIGIYISCLTILCHVTLVTSQTSTDAKNLWEKLFVTDGYEKRVVPAASQTDPIGK